jgi:hypothetical protein
MLHFGFHIYPGPQTSCLCPLSHDWRIGSGSTDMTITKAIVVFDFIASNPIYRFVFIQFQAQT